MYGGMGKGGGGGEGWGGGSRLIPHYKSQDIYIYNTCHCAEQTNSSAMVL